MRSRILRLSASALAAALLLAGPSARPVDAAPAPAAATASDPVVTTESGQLRGFSADGVESFLGVPYAAPPVGALRWQPPQPAASWSGVRDATSYGARCPALASTNGPRSTDEDCLFLNVQRPRGAKPGSDLPVYVFIHGGGLVNGSSNQADGQDIVRETNAVVVSMNYRLGVFGFLGLAGLSDHGEGDYGFLDQQAALRWVQRNIGGFGGDPAAVTVDGESAGAFSVCGHEVAPGSRGLFAQAIMHSGGCPSRSLSSTRADSRTSVVRDSGCAGRAPSATLACLRGLSTLRLLRAGTGFSPTLTDGTETFPVPLTTAVRRGDVARVPMIIGSNRDEGRTFFAGYIGASRADYEDFVRTTYGERSDAVLARYPWPRHANRFTAAYRISDVATDSGLFSGIGGCGTLGTAEAFARYNPVHLYEFAARRGPGLTPIPGYEWGAGHAAELAYFFPSFDNGTPIAPTFNAGQRQLSRDLIRYWGSFVFTGDPGGAGASRWAPLDQARFLDLRPAGRSKSASVSYFRAEHRCDFWGTGYSGL